MEELHSQKNSSKSLFETHIKPVLKYVGLIGASIMSVLYVALVVVLITGIKEQVLADTIIFAVVTAGMGLIVMQFLKYQGTAFAKEIPKNKEILDKYYKLRAKKKKVHSIKYYWTTSVIMDVLSRGLTLIITTTGIIYIVIQGMKDYTLLLLAFVNLAMFICFGMLSMANAYDYYNTSHIPFIEEQLNNYKKEKGNE